jgi:serine/threonine protein kinase
VADWGLVRRPRGQTTTIWTKTGVSLGTDGFAAPELSNEAHDAGPPADIFSLGQTIGWSRTGTWPQPNIPLLPDSDDRWRPIVRAATHLDPIRRPQTVAEFLTLVAEELDVPPTPAMHQGSELMEKAKAGDRRAGQDFILLPADNLDDSNMLIDVVYQMPEDLIDAEVGRQPDQFTELVLAMKRAMIDGEWGQPRLRSCEPAHPVAVSGRAGRRSHGQMGSPR